MTTKERLQQIVSAMSEEEAADALALVVAACVGATPTNIYGTAWGKVLANADPQALAVTGNPTITIQDATPGIT